MQPALSPDDFIIQEQLDGLIAIYWPDHTLARADINDRGDARNHILDLIAEAQEEAAQLAADHAEAERQIAIDLTLSEIEASIAALIREAA